MPSKYLYRQGITEPQKLPNLTRRGRSYFDISSLLCYSVKTKRVEQILCRAKKKKNAFFNSESTVLSIFHAYNYLIKLFYNFSREVELCKRVLVRSSFPCLGSFVKPGQVCCTVHKSRCKGKHISDPSIVQQFIRRISNYLKPGFKS